LLFHRFVLLEGLHHTGVSPTAPRQLEEPRCGQIPVVANFRIEVNPVEDQEVGGYVVQVVNNPQDLSCPP